MSDTAWEPTAPLPWSDPGSDPLADIQAFAARALWTPPYEYLIPEQLARSYPEMADLYNARILPEPAPAPPHPWHTAIEARRNRNTGPAQRPAWPKKTGKRRA